MKRPRYRAHAARLLAVATIALAVGALRANRAHAVAGSSYGDIVGCGSSVTTGLEQIWFRADYLAWQLSGSDLPPLITTSPEGTPLADAGVISDDTADTTTILAGNDQVGDRVRSGYMLSVGYWLNPCNGTSIIADYFYLGRNSFGYTAGPSDDLIIARPFFNADSNLPDAQLVNVPDELSGSVRVSNYEDFQSAGVALQTMVWTSGDRCSGREKEVFLIGGYRYYHHDSSLLMAEDITALENNNLALIEGTTIDLEDRFSARNEFHGGEIGLSGRIQQNEWWIDGLAMLAIGGNTRFVKIAGQTTVFVPGDPNASPTRAGGLLTSAATNIGTYRDTNPVAIPRFRLGGGCQLTDHISLRAGYNVLIWQHVVSAANELPAGLASDPGNLPPITGGGTDPAFPGIRGDLFVAHGLDLGLQFEF